MKANHYIENVVELSQKLTNFEKLFEAEKLREKNPCSNEKGRPAQVLLVGSNWRAESVATSKVGEGTLRSQKDN